MLNSHPASKRAAEEEDVKLESKSEKNELDQDDKKYGFKFTLSDAVRVEEEFRKQGIVLDTNVVPLAELVKGMNVEREHGSHNYITNVTYNSRMMSAKIALAHFEEDPHYYMRLEKMEKEGENHWNRNGGVPKIFKAK